MATFKSEFQDLAAELIDDEFADFRRVLVFSCVTGGSYDPVTETTTSGTPYLYTYKAIPSAVDLKEWKEQDIQINDVVVTYTRIDSFKPTVSDTCIYDSLNMQVKAAMYDSANATIKLVLRAL